MQLAEEFVEQVLGGGGHIAAVTDNRPRLGVPGHDVGGRRVGLM